MLTITVLDESSESTPDALAKGFIALKTLIDDMATGLSPSTSESPTPRQEDEHDILQAQRALELIEQVTPVPENMRAALLRFLDGRLQSFLANMEIGAESGVTPEVCTRLRSGADFVRDALKANTPEARAVVEWILEKVDDVLLM